MRMYNFIVSVSSLYLQSMNLLSERSVLSYLVSYNWLVDSTNDRSRMIPAINSEGERPFNKHIFFTFNIRTATQVKHINSIFRLFLLEKSTRSTFLEVKPGSRGAVTQWHLHGTRSVFPAKDGRSVPGDGSARSTRALFYRHRVTDRLTTGVRSWRVLDENTDKVVSNVLKNSTDVVSEIRGKQLS